MLCPVDNGDFRLRRNGIWRGRTIENRQCDRRWRNRAGGCEDARWLVMCGIARPLSIAS